MIDPSEAPVFLCSLLFEMSRDYFISEIAQKWPGKGHFSLTKVISSSLIDDPSIQDRHIHLNIADVFRIDAVEIAVEDRDIRPLSWFQRAFDLLFAGQTCAVVCHHLDGFLHGDAFGRA